MARIDLKYGRQTVAFDYDESRFAVLQTTSDQSRLTDAAINERLDGPIGSAVLEDLIAPGQTVLLVVPDATRQAAAGQVANLVIRRLIANGTAPGDIRIIFATGIHRKVTDKEKAEILTPFVFQRIRTLDHDPRDLMQLIRLGEMSGGIAVELNRALVEHNHVVVIGCVSFHYFAGFTGSRKLICPGLASARTIAATHKLAFDCERLARRDGVGTALLDGNAVHEAFIEAATMAKPRFAINTIVNDRGEAVDLFCGDWIESHGAACDAYASSHIVVIPEKRDAVIVSCGGQPYDINMIQAHKALEAASHACNDGGTIVLLAACSDGLGRDDFLQWFDAASSQELAARLCEKYQVNGQTAWSLLRKAERFDIRLVSSLPGDTIAKMRLSKMGPADVGALAAGANSGYFIPSGARLAITTD